MSVTAIAIGALVFVGSGLTAGIAQMSDSSSGKSFSGSLNSLVDASDGKYIVGGEWTLSLDGSDVTEFNADIDMVSIDGTGVHTHRIVISDTATQTASTEDLEVVLVPTEQSAGTAVLVNVTGLAEGSNVTVKVDDNITGLTESDEDGNLLYALGTTESMVGSLTVSVEDGEGNSGSAPLTVTEAQEDESQNASGTNNVTGPTSDTSSTNNNLTGTSSNNATTSANGTISSESSDNDAGLTGEIQNNTAGTDSSSNQPDYTIQTEIQSSTFGSENTTLSTPLISNDTTTSSTAGSNLTNSPRPNATDTTNNENLTSFKAESSVVAEIAANTTTFTTKADIYLNDEPKWEDVDITVSLTNGRVLAIDIDSEATDEHFGQEPIYGIATLAGDSYS